MRPRDHEAEVRLRSFQFESGDCTSIASPSRRSSFMFNSTQASARLNRRTRAVLAGAVAVTAALGGASAAQATTTSPVASPLTSPNGGLVLAGRTSTHVWVSDHINGVCRVDGSAINPSTCVISVAGSQLKPGQLSFDPATSNIYVPDLSSKSIGVARLTFNPAGDGGAGSIGLFDRNVVLPNCGLGGNLPQGSAMGPDGALYIAQRKSNTILKVRNPATTTACSDKVTIGQSTPGSRLTFSLGFDGSDLYTTDNRSLGRIPNATTCAGGCAASSIGFGTIVAPNA